MTPQQADPLAQLRDIHLPEAVSAWPPAPGWWLLALLAFGLLAFGALRLATQRKRNRYRRLALTQLSHIEDMQADSARYLQRLNQLLKQTTLAAPVATEAASLSGEQWLTFLDRTGSTTIFSQGPGQLLLTGPYAQTNSSSKQQLQQLHSAARDWIKNHRLQGVSLPC